MRSWRTIFIVTIVAIGLLAACTGAPSPTPAPVVPSTPIPTASPVPAAPQPVPPFPVAVTHDLIYTAPEFRAILVEKLDVYAPEGATDGGWPVVIFAHGSAQQKRDFAQISTKVAEAGTVVFTVDWTPYSGGSILSGNGKQVREMGETLLCAVRFAHVHAGEYGGDANRVILVGFSAGAWMGAQVALAGEELENRWTALAESAGEPPRQVDCTAPNGSPNVDAFVGIAGPYAAIESAAGIDPDLRHVIEISAYVGERPDLRVRLLHGRTDGVVKQFASEVFLALLVDAGYDAQLALFDEGHKVPHELVLEAVAELGK